MSVTEHGKQGKKDLCVSHYRRCTPFGLSEETVSGRIGFKWDTTIIRALGRGRGRGPITTDITATGVIPVMFSLLFFYKE